MKIDELYQLFLDCKAVNTDTRNVETNDMFFALSGENFNGNTFANEALQKGAKYAIIDDEDYRRSDKTILVSNTLKTLQKLATYHRQQLGLKIISLTGSNGKTTTKELINTVLSKKYKTTATIGNLNNHIGVPLTLLSMTNTTEIGIVEMGANHKKEIEFLCQIAQPDFGYITNFGKAHLEGFGGVEGVIQGKSELYDYLTSNNKTIFFNADDNIQKEKLSQYKNSKGYSQNNTDYYLINLLKANPFVNFKAENTTIQSNLIGDYNITNLSVATLIGKYFDVSINDIKAAIQDYVPTNNRSQIIKKDTNTIIMDAYNANPSSMEVALQNLNNQNEKNKIAILGDMFELGASADTEHQNIANLANHLNIDEVILIGENFIKTKTENNKVKQYRSFEDFKTHYKPITNSHVLIKGSRGMALERVLKLL
ncbi:UDP-N-acetylmuramoyl-tripeptide--D-alanyl-D-alanine ligase [Olleya sp. YSTF-M6]|uniref:UDP-N-acetylmuramoyl-tripeptide--D-alanyl-D-alanine ligase n=1 Tax=Olleya sediminilitoris TaxID=2795739 RepID=A0ABS1WLX6_9FLAO|nr:UDP-N-acetylmuramoyl-tripeptide--D-alanyl-D-alanine ligase [Olleya sediminilitoris]MBL7560103.1 UDP-N-acetylmuramoyl-tripeptide--D-alanyl-D-alanine ligase [Olleya sediminilitoris]